MKKFSKVMALCALTCVWGGAALLSVSCSNSSDGGTIPITTQTATTPATTTTTSPATDQTPAQNPTPTTFTVTFDTDGGSEVAAQTVNENGKATKPADPTKDVVNGISVPFLGWYSDSAKTTPFNFDAAITATTTIYAKWLDGFRSVPAKTFGGTAITDSQVFIASRNLSLPAIYACDHEVTQGEYETYCKYGGDNAPSDTYGKGTSHPVYYVSWHDAIAYCNLKSAADGLTPCYKLGGSNDTKNWAGIVKEGDGANAKYCGPSTNNDSWNGITCDWSANGWRLPTDAEWEMLARGGNLTNTNQTTYSGSNTIGDVAWYGDNSGDNGTSTNQKTHQVKGKAKNGLGLYDMSGNVWELCWDWHGTITATGDNPTPATGASSGSGRVVRGGGCDSSDNICSVAIRGYNAPSGRNDGYLGFRVVRNAPSN